MDKGFNTLLEETKQSLIRDVNGALKAGLPVGCIQLIIEVILSDTKSMKAKAIIQEQKTKEEQPKKEN